jgi:ATP-dependent Lhr-like helicase
MFGTRWRWNASIALAVKRMQGGKRLPPQFQRSDAEDLLSVVFPDQLACAENLGTGEREIPDHPLVKQTVDDCLHLTMDVDGLEQVLRRIESGAVRVIACDLSAPSPLAWSILNARPYAFLDDGAAEERRTMAVRQQPLADVRSAADLGRLDAQAVEQVRAEAWPEIGGADELHDALVVHGFMTRDELLLAGDSWLPALQQQKRVGALMLGHRQPVLVAAERLHEFEAVFPGLRTNPEIRATSSAKPDAGEALREIVRSRLELLGPVTETQLAAPLGLENDEVRTALFALEAEGAVMRGGFSAPTAQEWCDRRLLARVHRYTRDRQRAAVQPVPPAQFLRFLFRWHRIAGEERRQGDEGLLITLRQLEGCALPAAAWEEDLLPARVQQYLPSMLDQQCAAGRVAWYRPVGGNGGEEGKRKSGPVRGTPVLLCERAALPYWQEAGGMPEEPPPLSPKAQYTLDSLRAHGASFFSDLQQDTGLIRTELELALGELVSNGLVTCDSFAGLRGLVTPAEKRARLRRRLNRVEADVDRAGRWSLTRRPRLAASSSALAEPHVEHIARVLLRRYGVVFRKLLEREDGLPPWRELFYVYRRLEARGEIRGGRFVNGFSGEQFALPDAAGLLRKVANEPAQEEHVAISAADPLNLVGILTPGEKVPRLPGNRVLFQDGVPVAVQAGGEVRYLKALDAKAEWEVKNLLIRKQRPGGYLGEPGRAQ